MEIIKCFFKALWWLVKVYLMLDILTWAGVGIGVAFTTPDWEEFSNPIDGAASILECVFELAKSGWSRFLSCIGFKNLVKRKERV